MYVWTFTVSVKTIHCYYVESLLEYPFQEEDYLMLKETKDNFAQLRFAAELSDIYD